MTDLLAELKAANQPKMPAGFKPGIVYSGRSAAEITTPWMTEDLQGATPAEWEEAVRNLGMPLSEDKTLELVEARFNSAAWHRDQAFTGIKDTAYTNPAWVYKFRVVAKSLRADGDLETLMKSARKASRTPKTAKVAFDDSTFVVNMADFQVGKVDELGGTPELLERSERALAEVMKIARQRRPAEILLVDVGDSTEGFESSPNAARTSDLQQTEQIRVWRRLLWRWVSQLADLRVPVKVISVPSNHCRVRRGKDAQGPPDDDWGLEVLSQVSDLVEAAGLSNVTLHAPRKYEEHVTLTLAGGKVLSIAHGHQERNVNRMTEWAKRQGRREIGLSDIVVVGHFHHLRVQSYGDGQTLFVCPTMDGGSSWFTPSSGERSRPGLLTFMVDSAGWRDIEVVWAA